VIAGATREALGGARRRWGPEGRERGGSGGAGGAPPDPAARSPALARRSRDAPGDGAGESGIVGNRWC